MMAKKFISSKCRSWLYVVLIINLAYTRDAACRDNTSPVFADDTVNFLVIARASKVDVRGPIIRYRILDVGVGDYSRDLVSIWVSTSVHNVDALPDDAMLVIVPNRQYSHEQLQALTAPVYRPIGYDPAKGVLEFNEALWGSLLATSPKVLLDTPADEQISVEVAVEAGRAEVQKTRSDYDVVPSYDQPIRIEHAWKIGYLVLSNKQIITIDYVYISDEGKIVEYDTTMF